MAYFVSGWEFDFVGYVVLGWTAAVRALTVHPPLLCDHSVMNEQ